MKIDDASSSSYSYDIGYTTGVFDLFHVGHLNILRRAKSYCRHLIVGVTTDELVSYKQKQAVIPFCERIEIVKSVRYVDEAVPQTNMDKLAAWENYRFNVVFVGDDWKHTPQWIEYEKQFSSIGVDVMYFPYTKTTSSTYLRDALAEIVGRTHSSASTIPFKCAATG